MADGTLRAIEDVELGDLVWARDPETGVVGARPVSDLIEGTGVKELVDVEVDGETITATDGHPFWVDDEGRWVDAEDLEVGDLLLLADGTTTEVDGVWHHTQTLTVHNLTVEGIHTYHVAIGEADALVHNCGEMESLADMRRDLGLPEAGASNDGATLARLDVGDQTFFGINGHGQSYPRPESVHPASMSHAEGDAFGQASRAGITGGSATLYVDRAPCSCCRSSLGGFARSLGLDELTVVGRDGPIGVYTAGGGGYRTL
jgi:hypothetical protein